MNWRYKLKKLLIEFEAGKIDIGEIETFVAKVIAGQPERRKPTTKLTDKNKIKNIREFAINASKNKTEPIGYYFCDFGNGEMYLVPYPAQHTILETPIYKI